MKEDLLNILKTVILWRIALFAVLLFFIPLIAPQSTFLLGSLSESLKNIYIYPWANFDGVHYLSIIQNGYRHLTYFFFPGFIVMGKALSFFASDRQNLMLLVLLLNTLLLTFAFYGIKKIIKLDFPNASFRGTIALHLLFPASFYFSSFYTESLFLFSAVWAVYCARKSSWIKAGIFAFVSTSTRLVGIAVPVAIFFELLLQKKLLTLKGAASLIVGISGLLAYLTFLYRQTGDPLEFFHSVSIYGQQRSSEIILLPQVMYRYFFKILPSIDYSYFPAVFSTWLEFISALVFLFLIFRGTKMRITYIVFFAITYIVPTLSGSFSSFGRYSLAMFPGFIIASQLLKKRTKIRKVIYIFLGVLLIVATGYFVRGYWIA